MAAEECSALPSTEENSYCHLHVKAAAAVAAEKPQPNAVQFGRPVRGDCPGGVAANERHSKIYHSHRLDTRTASFLGV